MLFGYLYGTAVGPLLDCCWTIAGLTAVVLLVVIVWTAGKRYNSIIFMEH